MTDMWFSSLLRKCPNLTGDISVITKLPASPMAKLQPLRRSPYQHRLNAMAAMNFTLGVNIPIRKYIPVCTAQGGSGSFEDRKPIGEVRCCESWMAEQTHWWIEKWLEATQWSCYCGWNVFVVRYSCNGSGGCSAMLCSVAVVDGIVVVTVVVVVVVVVVSWMTAVS